jgi:hypothetical protein
MAGNSVYLYGSVGPTIRLNIAGLNPGFIARYGTQFTLGGGLPGSTPQELITTDVGYEDYMNDRDIVVDGWNTNYRREKVSFSGVPARAITPFRAVNNAGDLLSRKYYTCGGPCQTFQSRPGIFGLKQRFGAVMLQCDGTGVEPAACNTKYVYDSSDYSRYLKQRAINQNYNALTNGGDESSASQSAWRAIRRF